MVVLVRRFICRGAGQKAERVDFMRNTPLLRGFLLFITVSAFVYDIFLLVKVSTHPESMTRAEYIQGYWVLPIALICLVLYSYLNKKSR